MKTDGILSRMYNDLNKFEETDNVKSIKRLIASVMLLNNRGKDVSKEMDLIKESLEELRDSLVKKQKKIEVKKESSYDIEDLVKNDKFDELDKVIDKHRKENLMAYCKTFEMFKYLHDNNFYHNIYSLVCEPFFAEAVEYAKIELSKKQIYELIFEILYQENNYKPNILKGNREYLLKLLGGTLDKKKFTKMSDTMSFILKNIEL